jgi:glycerophosphoryl diester phosphodiesterase
VTQVARLPSLLDPPITFAHRGARAHAPENTLEAFTLALRLGATGIESDVWITADGVAVLDHDGIVRRGRRKVPIARIERDALPDHLPALADVLPLLGPDNHLSLDLKAAGAAPAVVETVRRVRPDLLPQLWLCHEDWRVVAALRDLDPDLKLVDSTRLNRIKEGPERRAATLRERGIDAINLHHTDWTGGLTTLFHRFERYALAWDLQHERVLRDVIRMGIDGVYSDWVDRMVDALVDASPAELGGADGES